MEAILLQVILIGLNAVFASAEIAVISMNDTKLERMARDGDARAKRLAALTAQPTKFLSTIQVAITLAGLLGSAFAAENFAGALVQVMQKAGIDAPERILKSFSVFLITLVLAYFNLVFGELVPKRVAMKKAEGLALGMSGMLTGVSRLFAPLVALLTISTNGVLKLFGIDPTDEKEEVSEEEIYMMLEAGEEKGTIDAEETRWIRNVFAFDDISVEEICTHRVDMTVLGLEESDAEWQETILRSGYTYYPIYKENTDNIIGVLNTKVYFRLMEKNREAVMAQAVEKPYFVLWGVWHGVFSLIEDFLPIRKLPGFFRHIYAMLVVCIGFVMFRADTFGQGIQMIGTMFTGWNFDSASMQVAVYWLNPFYLVMLFVGILGCMPILPGIHAFMERGAAVKRIVVPFSYVGSVLLLLLSMMSLSSGTYNPFIYFRF